jgi:hypothetical protein
MDIVMAINRMIPGKISDEAMGCPPKQASDLLSAYANNEFILRFFKKAVKGLKKHPI